MPRLRLRGVFQAIQRKILPTADTFCKNSPQAMPLFQKFGLSKSPIASSFLTASAKESQNSKSKEYLELLRALPIHVETQDLWLNVELESLARRQNLAAYDVAYLALAQRKGLPLATSDAALRQAAMAEGIKVLG